MKSFFLLLVPFTFLGTACQPSQSVKDQRPPNVIVILTDDQGYKDVGFNNSPDIVTPHIDRIAQNGVKFTNGYVSYAVCGPSRAGLITGRYQDRFGFSRNPLFAPKDSLQGLPLSEETLATALKKSGYSTMAIGKWHLGAHPSLRPLNRGFDEFFGFLSGGHRYFPEDWKLKDISEIKAQFDAYNTKLLRNDQRIEEKEYLTDALSREAVDFVRRKADQPFFLYLAYNAPHSPLQATEEYLKRYAHIQDEQRRTYAAMVSAVDDGVGDLLDTLEDLGIADNTIVFFLSDNGGPENKGANNGELRKGKGSLHEGGIRVPFAVQWPGRIPAGKEYPHPVISLDIFATAIAQAGGNARNPLDGVDLLPYLTGESDNRPHPRLFWRKFDAQAVAIRDGDLKLVRDRKNDSLKMYDLTNDIGESSPLTDSNRLEELRKLHEAWNRDNLPPPFLGLMQDKEYSRQHPDRFANNEEY